VLLKREDLQPVFSFKLRGAYNRIAICREAKCAARRGVRLGRQSRARELRSPRAGAALRR